MTEPGWWSRDRPEDGREQGREQAYGPGAQDYGPGGQGYTQPIPQHPTRPIGPPPGVPPGRASRPPQGPFRGPLQDLAPGQGQGRRSLPPASRRRGRGWAALLVVLVCLGLLAAAADRGAAKLAERALGRGVQTEQRLARPADVSIAGVPFLTQAFNGRYRQIDLAAAGVPTGNGLTVDRITVRLTDVTANASDLIAGRADRLRAGRVTVRALVGYRALDAVVADQLRSDALTVRFADGGGDRLAVTGTVRTPLGELQLRGKVRATLVGQGIRLRLVAGSVQGLPNAVDQLLSDLLDVTLAAPDQVSGLRPTGIEVGPTGITLTGAGTDVPLGILAR